MIAPYKSILSQEKAPNVFVTRLRIAYSKYLCMSLISINFFWLDFDGWIITKFVIDIVRILYDLCSNRAR